MKIAISTINDYGNYGNRLQNYALQEVLRSLGNDTVTIKNFSGLSKKDNLKKSIVHLLGENSNITFAIKKILSLFSRKGKLNFKRAINFSNFTNNNIKQSNFIINEKTTNFDFDDSFDCYVIGSDQVWNYSFPRFSKLDFIEYSKKPKLSYAASFGVSQIPNKLNDFYRFGLNGIDYISVREYAGKNIVSKLITNKKVEVVLDPTLLLSREDWLQVSSNDVHSKKFIVVYFLGMIPNEWLDYIKIFAKSRSYEIKHIFSYDDEKSSEAGPSQFIDLFSKAEAVFTDSFHAVVFSIIFQKYFEVFERVYDGLSMNSRIDTLLKDLDLTDRWYSKGKKVETIDYFRVTKLLDSRKDESMRFLESSLKKIEESING